MDEPVLTKLCMNIVTCVPIKLPPTFEPVQAIDSHRLSNLLVKFMVAGGLNPIPAVALQHMGTASRSQG